MTLLAEPLEVALTPMGHVVLRAGDDASSSVSGAPAARLAKAFDSGSAAGLLHLGWVESSTPLPPAFAFWRDFARSLVAAVCTRSDVEELRGSLELPADAEALAALALAAPPMTGAEYLDGPLLERLWAELLDELKAELRRHPKQSVQALLAARNPDWHVVGKVHFHLAENRRDPERPFAFLASYTTGLSEQGKPRHRPLGEAVRDSTSAKDKSRLLALLAPVKRAAEGSEFVRALVDSGDVFRPLAWGPREAHRFLKQVGALENSGVVVRVPDWWKARRPPRPRVTVRVGAGVPSALGLEAMLDFSVGVTLDGEALTPEELAALRRGSDGLVLLKGRWVEVDREKLEQVLAHWRQLQAHASEGLPFAEALRLLAGAAIEEPDEEAPAREWSGVEAGPWLKQTLERLREPADAEVGPELRAELRPYQRRGVQWLWALSQLRLGACLADDMGLGKTVQVLALLLRRRRESKEPALLVVPASLLANWKAEAERFAPSLKLLVAHPSEPGWETTRDAGARALDGADAVLTSYGTLQRLGWLSQVKWGLVGLDEAQAIKNPAAKQTKAVKALQCASRVALTGTPVENRLGDLWSLFDFLNPGLLGTAKQLSQYVKREGAYASLRELTRPYILRRLKTDRAVISDLPEKTELKAFCALTKAQAVLYQQSVDSLAQELKGAEGIQRRGLVLSYLMRFKQICNHPSQWLGDGAYDAEQSGKHARLLQLCEVVASRQEKVLVFTQFRELAAPLSRWLERAFGRPGLVLTGSTPVKQRQVLVKRFQEDEQVPFFVLSLKAGGTGLNLTAASHVVHFDRWWNPAVENQATDRAFRIGQKKNVLVHKLVCRGTIEERIDELIESKKALAEQLLSGGEELKLSELSDAELMKMVSLDLHAAREEG